jgi:hypothetical protein
VYAFEIVFLLKNGKQTDGFHIPGREIGYNDIYNIQMYLIQVLILLENQILITGTNIVLIGKYIIQQL